ncbi:MAG: SGNH/GDSL hydrolase family protein [Bacteroidetes bacterium]|nr:SGNH/GDSL hydrolase family protein [Bacteroidota bacterium]
MKTKICIYFLLLTSYFLLSTCRPNLKNPEPSSGDADFSKFIALGGSFIAGYQDGALYKDGQQYSLAYQLAKYIHLAGGPAEFVQPFMPDNSGLGLNPKSWESDFETSSKLRFKADCKGVSSLFPIKDDFNISSAGIYLQHQSGNFQNFGVPFAKISDYTNSSLGNSGNSNPYYARFASSAGVSTMLSDAKAQQPTFFALWAGMEDVYDYVSHGAYSTTILSPSSFYTKLDSVLSQLPSQGVIANIPDFTSFPFYTTIPWDGLELTRNLKDSLNMLYFGDSLYSGSTAFQIGKNGFMIEDPASTAPPPGYRKMRNGDYILLSVPIDSMKCNFLGAFTPMPDQYVLDTSEVKVVNQIIADYNNVITVMAQKYKLALVDMNAYFKKVQTGIKWDGEDFNAEFVSGGFFSLDGYHPNQKGYVLVANEFIRAINSKYNATVPWVNCPECSGIKFP